jgi:uncharacterized protein YbaP (TraB family)
MQKVNLFCFLQLFLCINCNNDSQTKVNTSASIQKDSTQSTFFYDSWMWKIEGKNLKSPSYLFGVFHQASNSIFDSFTNAKKKLLGCKTLIIENTKEKSDLKKYMTVENMKASWKIWQSILDKESEEVMKQYIIKTRSSYLALMSGTHASRLVEVINYPKLCPSKDSTHDLESYLESLTRKKLNTIGLDDEIDFQVKSEFIFEKNAYQLDPEGLKYMIQSMKEYLMDVKNSKLCSALSDYLNYNIDYAFETFYDNKKYSFDERNSKWIPIIEKQINTNSSFIAVGFQHLRYNNGLIKRLEKQGYKLSAVKLKGN